MRILIIMILSVFITLSTSAQDKYDPEIIVASGINEIEAYIFEEEGKADSFLITKEYFNKKGRRTKIAIYDSIGIRTEYIYLYRADTLRIERITKSRGTVINKTEIYYDKKNREVKAIDYDIYNRKTGNYSETKYNDRKSTKEIKIYFSNRLAFHTREKYGADNELIACSIKEDGKWILQWDENTKNPNHSKIEIENYQESGLKFVKVEKKIESAKIILGIKERLELNIDDILITEKYINKKGLVEYEKQYLNDQFIGLKKYRFIL